jgi:iron(III) transport system substrate-binding protein
MRFLSGLMGFLAVTGIAISTANATDKPASINLYTARHYEADKAIYAAFTQKTGIAVHHIIAEGGKLFARLKAEGAKSPADVLLTTDLVTLARAAEQNLFQPVDSKTLQERIPASYRDAKNRWYAFTLRPRVIAYDAVKGLPEGITGYASLSNPAYKGMVCTRSSANEYSSSLLTYLVGAWGEAKTSAWTKGLVANFARAPQGNDTAQLQAIAAGECRVALVNSYYAGKLLLSDNKDEQALGQKIGLLFPDQDSSGVFANISGAGIAKGSANVAGAKQFLEFLASDEAQRLFADLNAENPVVEGVAMPSVLKGMTPATIASVPLHAVGKNAITALKVADEAKWR